MIGDFSNSYLTHLDDFADAILSRLDVSHFLNICPPSISCNRAFRHIARDR